MVDLKIWKRLIVGVQTRKVNNMSLKLYFSNPIITLKGTYYWVEDKLVNKNDIRKVHKNTRMSSMVIVTIGKKSSEVPLEDFLEGVKYLLTNTDIMDGDGKLNFVDWIKSLKEVKGYDKKLKRLE